MRGVSSLSKLPERTAKLKKKNNNKSTFINSMSLLPGGDKEKLFQV